jgi:hypothetical protein
MSWPEAMVLVAVAAGATVANALHGVDPVPVYTAVVAWGARGVAVATRP